MGSIARGCLTRTSLLEYGLNLKLNCKDSEIQPFFSGKIPKLFNH